MLRFDLPVKYHKLTQSEKKSVREQYIAEQKGLCFYCKNKLTENPSESVMNKVVNKRLFPPNFFGNPIHLQHSHDTGLTEGAVHAYCNAVMWEYDGR